MQWSDDYRLLASLVRVVTTIRRGITILTYLRLRLCSPTLVVLFSVHCRQRHVHYLRHVRVYVGSVAHTPSFLSCRRRHIRHAQDVNESAGVLICSRSFHLICACFSHLLYIKAFMYRYISPVCKTMHPSHLFRHGLRRRRYSTAMVRRRVLSICLSANSLGCFWSALTGHGYNS
jgi:hypothetical protein